MEFLYFNAPKSSLGKIHIFHLGEELAGYKTALCYFNDTLERCKERRKQLNKNRESIIKKICFVIKNDQNCNELRELLVKNDAFKERFINVWEELGKPAAYAHLDQIRKLKSTEFELLVSRDLKFKEFIKILSPFEWQL